MTLDADEMRVRSIVLNAAWRAHGGRLPVEECDICEECRGDGCGSCGGTGFVKS